MYSNSAALALAPGRKPGTVHGSILRDPKKLSIGALSRQFPLRAHGGLDAMEAEQFAVVTAGILGEFNRSLWHRRLL